MAKSIRAISGRISSVSRRYTDRKWRIEIPLYKKGTQHFLNQDRMRFPVPFSIGSQEYIGGISFIETGMWVNPDLIDGGKRKVRLVDALEFAGFKEGQKVVLEVEKYGIRIVSLN
ncbi:MAG: hypothetical protein HYY41_01785 [Chloroflexi bacterium]|nr:hypothetical protein [Chloroflexota bacterium]